VETYVSVGQVTHDNIMQPRKDGISLPDNKGRNTDT
jgi:hypothetical protein